jgi:hypothetical protein
MTSPVDARRRARVPLRASVTRETEDEIARLRPRYGTTFEEIERDLRDLRTTGVIERAQDLAAITGQHFNHNELPHYFFGDLDATFVLVHLNPKQADNRAGRFPPGVPVASFLEYFDAHRHFGIRTYGPSSPRDHKSPFDHKQIRFLRAFGVIDFVEEHKPEDRFTNLERALDEKLQLELIPYGSDAFSARRFTEGALQPHYERLMNVITSHRRQYVIFCGAVFDQLFKPHVVDEHRFEVMKVDGSPARQMARFANVRLPYRDRTVAAGLASSWARQGLPMESYASEVRARYTG